MPSEKSADRISPWGHFIKWLDWHGRAATVMVILVSFGGAAIANQAASIWGNVYGIYLWTVSLLVFVVFIGSFEIVAEKLRHEAIAPLQDTGGQTQTPPAPAELRLVKSNIRCLGPLTTQLRLGLEGHGYYEDVTERFAQPAAMVCFRNEASTERKVKLVFNVRASIVFMDDSGREMGMGIAEACWLGDLRGIDFTLEQTNCVVAAILLKDGTFTCPAIHRTRTRWGDGIATELHRFDVHPKTIEVRLIKENELLLRPCMFDFVVADGRPLLKQRPEPSR